jgi:hypothetical protein
LPRLKPLKASRIPGNSFRVITAGNAGTSAIFSGRCFMP